MKQLNFKSYFDKLSDMFFRIKVSNSSGKRIDLFLAFDNLTNKIKYKKSNDTKIIIIGNGGSASIASHIATDFLKNSGIPAITFNDSSLITCLSNDLGYEYVFAKPIGMLAKKGDIVFAISSSGESKNILNAAKEAKRKECFLVTLSGFDKDNLLRKLGEINFYVPSDSYGYVEITHLTICHYITDKMTGKSNG